MGSKNIPLGTGTYLLEAQACKRVVGPYDHQPSHSGQGRASLSLCSLSSEWFWLFGLGFEPRNRQSRSINLHDIADRKVLICSPTYRMELRRPRLRRVVSNLHNPVQLAGLTAVYACKIRWIVLELSPRNLTQSCTVPIFVLTLGFLFFSSSIGNPDRRLCLTQKS